MPTEVPEGFSLGTVEPVEAVAAFAARGLLQVSFAWQDVWQQEHARAFTISRLTRTDLLGAVRAALDDAIRDGTRFETFAKTVQPQLEAAGWWGKVSVVETPGAEPVTTTFNPQRLRLIFDVNTRQSYAAGRWERIERTKDRFPLVMYRTMRDERVRNSHRPWDGVALPVGHAFWHTHYPPNGWRCRCTAFAVDAEQLARYRAAGINVKTDAPEVEFVEFTNRRTGEVSQVPRGIDPGFAYNPGQAGAGAGAGAGAA